MICHAFVLTFVSLDYLSLTKTAIHVEKSVLHVIDNMCLGGAQRIVSTLVENNENHMLHVLRESDEALYGFNDYTVTASSSRFNLRSFYDVWRKVRKHDPDVVHCHLKKSKLAGTMVKIATLKEFNLILHEHGEIWKENRKYEFILEHMNPVIDCHVAVSRHTAELLKQRAQVPREKIEVLYNFVDTEKFSPESLNSLEPHPASYEDKFRVGYGGRLAERKGWNTVVEAAEELEENFQILMTGSGPGEEELKKKEKKIKNLHYLGYLDDVRTLFASIDCFVLPSKWDPSPMILYEVHSCGVPLICTDAHAIDELVDNRQNGLLFEPGDVDGLLSKIRLLRQDTQIRRKITEEGLKLADQKSLSNYRKSLENLYNDLEPGKS
jgi:glycosyltransferase involved in cell wall biosynthesis